MKCPRCTSPARLIYARTHPTESFVTVRRYGCKSYECGHRYTTHEGTATLVAHRVKPKPRKRKTQPPTAEQVEARKVYRLRQMARDEARATGRLYREVLTDWNVPPTPKQAALLNS